MHLRKLKLSAALALTMGAPVLAATAPAGAATGSLVYSCSGSGFGEVATAYPFQAVVDTDLPATLPYGASRATAWSTELVAPESFRSWVQGQGFTSLTAIARTQTARDGVALPLLDQETPGLAVPATPGLWTWTMKPVTTQMAATTSGSHSLTVSSLQVSVAAQKGNVNALLATASCVLDPATPAASTVIDSYEVVAAATSTALAFKGDTATATVTSTGAAPEGSVTFSIDGKTVSDVLKHGTASAKLPSVRPGTHTVLATFVPANATQFVASTGTASYVAARISTTSTVTAVRRPARRLVKAKAVVAAKDRSVVSGRVTFVLKRNGRTLSNKTVSVSSAGVAKTVFRNVRTRGRYAVVATYIGDSTYEGSRDRVRLS